MEQKEKVILFGRGMVYQRKKEILHEKYRVEVFLDNSVTEAQYPVKDDETGITVVNPADISRYPDIPIILLSYALGDMYRQLTESGVEKERIRFGPMMKPYNTFERMLFEDGGRLISENDEILYRNEKLNLCVKTDTSDLEKLVEIFKENRLYQDSRDLLDTLPPVPLDDKYGMNRGTPVDRYYIEQFLQAQKELIRGTVMEIGDRVYTEKFGERRVEKSIILHRDTEVSEINQIKGDFVTGEGLTEESVDCLICTQTLPFIYDLCSAANNIVKILKRGGVALLTVGGISPIIQYEMHHWGHFWSFTDMSLRKLFEEIAGVASVEVCTYGNVKSATAFLYGISYEELSQDELNYQDPAYQLIIAAIVKKR